MKNFLKILLISVVSLVLLLAGFVIWSVGIEPNMLVVKKVQLRLPDWQSEHDNFKIAVLTDMHIGSNGTKLGKVKRLVKLTNKQKPDMILLLGDIDPELIKQSEIKQDEIIEALKQLSAPYGVISILGNHDFDPPDVINEVLTKSNISVLEDKIIDVKKDGKGFYIVGLRDIWQYAPDVDVKKVVGEIKDDYPIILLSHNPDIFPEVPESVSLTLSGHHHGGQISFPFVGGLFINSEYGQRYTKGHIVENGKHLYVSSGIGTLFYARFANPPEIVILNLNKETDPNKYIINTPPIKGISKNIVALNPVLYEWFKKYLPEHLQN